MNNSSFKKVNRVLSVLLVFLLLIGSVPITVFAANGAKLETDIGGKSFKVGVATEFTFSTVANDDKDANVVGSLSFGDPDAVEKLECLDEEGQWKSFDGALGSAEGFALIDSTKSLRVTFKKDGKNSLNAFLQSVESGEKLDSLSVSFDVAGKSKSELASDIATKDFVVGEKTEFSLSVSSHDYLGTNVSLALDFAKEGTVEYYDSVKEQWSSFDGESFELSDRTFKFRAVFDNAGSNSLTASLKYADGESAGEVLCSTEKLNFSVKGKYKVTLPKNVEGGTVTLDREGTEFVEGTELTLTVTPDENHYISKISLNGSDEPFDTTGAVKKFVVDGDVDISVSFVEVFTVEVKIDGNGAVSTTPVQTEGGVVKITTGSSIMFTATPEKNFKVGKVTFADDVIASFEGYDENQGEAYSNTLTPNKSGVLKVTFVPVVYKIEYESTGSGSVKASKTLVDHGEDVTVTLTPAAGYSVAEVKVNGTVVSDEVFEEVGGSDTELALKISNVTENKKISAEFSKIDAVDADNISWNYSDALRISSDRLTYVFSNNANVKFRTTTNSNKKRIKAAFREDGSENIREFVDDSSLLNPVYEVNFNSKDFTKLYIEKVTIGKGLWFREQSDIDFKLPAGGKITIVFDKKAPTVKVEEADESQKVGGYYSNDVKLNINAEDPTDDYSGLREIKYWVESNGVQTVAPTTVYEHKDSDGIKKTLNSSKEIVIDAKKNNSEDVVVYVQAFDRAGNASEIKKIPLKICASAPSVSVKFDDEQSAFANTEDNWYNFERKATVTVYDREDVFDSAAASSGFKFAEGSSNDIEVSTWTKNGNSQTATVTFKGEGTFAWEEYSYKNKAGLEASSVTATGENAYSFKQDFSAPSGTLKASSSSWDEKGIDWTELLEKLTFGLYSTDKVTVRLSESSDNLSGLQKVEYFLSTSDEVMKESELISLYNDGKFVSDEITVDSDMQFAVYARLVDNAGNVRFIGTNGIIYDVTVSTIDFKAVDKANENSIYGENNVEKYVVTNEKSEKETIEHGIKYNVTVKDLNENSNNSYSGIKKIEYRVVLGGTKVGSTVQSGTLFSFENAAPEKKDLVFEKTCDIIIDADKANGKEVVLEVTVTDNAGNKAKNSTTIKEINLDKIDAEISVVGKPVKAEGDFGWYNSTRSAVISINDRESCFDEEAATKAVKVKATDLHGNEVALSNADFSISSWSSKNNTHTATVTFSGNANYSWSFDYTNLAGNRLSEENIEYKGETPKSFAVDSEKPTGIITVGEYSWTDRLLSVITFGIYSPKKLDISASSDDKVSPTKIEYYLSQGNSSLRSDNTVSPYEALEALYNNGDFKAEVPTLEESQQATVYARVTDNAGNYIYISSDGFVIDPTQTELSLEAIEKPGENECYGIKDLKEYTVDGETFKGVKLAISASEAENSTESYAGIKSITYEVTSTKGGKKQTTQSGTLYSFDYVREGKENSNGGTLTIKEVTTSSSTRLNETIKNGKYPTKDDLRRAWSGCIIVNAEENNACDTVVKVTVTDNAGNSTSRELALDIDLVAPSISLKYDNNNAVNEKYYNAKRTATLTFTERPHHFDRTAAEQNIKITAKDALNNDVKDAYSIRWTDNINLNDPDSSTFVATIDFNKDANYTLSVAEADPNVGYTDKAGNTAAGVRDEFTIDTEDPTGTVTINENKWTKALNAITFGLFSNSSADVSISAEDKTSPYKIEYAYTNASEPVDPKTLDFKEYINAFKFENDKQFDVYARITDFAGHQIIVNSDGYIVDKQNAEFEVYAENSTNENGIYNLSSLKEYKVDNNDVFGVKVKIDVNEPAVMVDGVETYSGIKEIAYEVRSTKEGINRVTQSGTLYSFDYVRSGKENSNGGTLTISEIESFETTKPTVTTYKNGQYPKKEQLLTSWSGAIIVNADENNSSDTVVEVTVTDNAGNVSKKTLPLDINATTPLVNVSFDSERNDKAKENYFTAVTATVTITDRKNHFSAENATNGISITAKNFKNEDLPLNYEVSDWKETVNEIDTDKTTYTATVKFLDDANYTFNASYVGKAGNANDGVTYADGPVKNSGFTVDTAAPQEASVSVNNNVWKKLLSILTFGLYSNVEAKVEMTAYDEISGVEIEYFKTNDPVAKDENFLDNQTFEPYDSENAPAVSSNEQFVFYVKVTDFAGNYRYISTDGYIVDKSEAKISLEPEQANKNGLYNKDVSVKIDVSENELETAPYSGIQKIEYWVVKDGKEETQREVLYLFDYTRETGENSNNGKLIITDLAADGEKEQVFTGNVPKREQLRRTWSHSVTVDSALNNSCDVELFVGVTDNAGNYSETSKKLDIDVTAPAISVSYDETKNDGAKEGYFTSRTATVEITERTHHFDAALATNGIKITAVDAEGKNVEGGYAISDWTTKEGATPDEAVHTATITYSGDANYTFSIEYTDNADNKNKEVLTNDFEAPFEFTVDATKPVGTITAKSLNTDKSSREETWNELVENLVFGFWSNKKISLSGTSSDATSPIMSVEYYMPVSKNAKSFSTALKTEELEKVTEWKAFDSLDVNANTQFVVYLKITDNAGNYTYISTNGLLVDDTHPLEESVAPEISIEPEKPVNGIYSSDVKVSIKVVDPEVNGAYSGLKDVRYAVFDRDSKTPNKPTQEGQLFEFTNKAPKQSELVPTFKGEIVVKASKNNSNNIQIVVYATDNSGNYVDNAQSGSQSYTVIKIDRTAPVINISYDNNRADSGTYFKADRTATIKITERNFDPDDVVITTTNTDGTLPRLSSWKTSKGTYNKDNTVHTATLSYTADGDYTFKIAYADKAGLKAKKISYGSSVAPKAFTIDKTAPKISVSYDNNAVSNGSYYTSARTATVVINEHNFSRGRINISLTAENGGTAAAVPAVNGWSTSGNRHTATIYYPGDAHYTFGISYTDLAGNRANSYSGDNFYVDKTDPELEITGVENNSANGDVVRPVITASDINFDDVQVTLTGANRGRTEAVGSVKATANGKTFTFSDFERKQSVDDIYTLTAVATDKAGRSTEKSISFSVNRFGSVYAVSDSTKKLNGTYVQEQQDVVIEEVNANKLSKIKLTLFKNNETLTLKEGTDYKISVTGGNGKWYRYVYTVFKSNFEDDGVYKLTVYSEDAAGNIAENTLDTKQTEINFGVDKTAPTINVKNLESGKTYPVESLDVMLAASDNLKLTKVAVVLDGAECASWSGEALEELVNSGDDFTFVVPGDSTEAHSAKIVATDAAGNEFEQDISDFYVTTNLWVRYFNNKPLFFGSIVALVLLIALVIFLVAKRKKNDKDGKK